MCLLCAMTGLEAAGPAKNNNPITPSSAKSYYTDALTHSYRWQDSNSSHTTITYSYSMATGTTDGYGLTSPSMLNASQQAYVISALEAWEQVANIHFLPSSGLTDVNIRSAILPANAAAWTGISTEGSAISHADIVLHQPYNTNPAPGTYSFMTVLHELGHALGLKHPGNYDVVGRATGPFLPVSEDSWNATLMSYHQGANANITHVPVTPMIYDIAAMQALYGANTSYNAGNTTYTLSGNASSMTFWDGGGIDTLDASSLTSNSSIDLREGLHNISHTGETFSWIAFGAHIENAIGGAGNDFLQGNALSNTLQGGSGNDSMFGGQSNDSIRGEEGDDVLHGNIGSDTLTGGAGNDGLFGGKDNDLLICDNGNDTLTGGKGNDTYLLLPGAGNVVISHFQQGEDLLAVSSALFSTISLLLGAVHYTAQGALLSLGSTNDVLILGLQNPLQGEDVSLV